MDETVIIKWLEALDRRVYALEQKALQNTALGPKVTCTEETAAELEKVLERLKQSPLRPQTDIRA